MATRASLKAKHFTKPLYNAATDFTPVVLITKQPTFLFVRPDLPAENPREFSAYVKANHAKMQFGSAGAGSPIHLACVLINSAIQCPECSLPGGAPAMQDLIAGRIDYLTATTSAPLACALVKTMLILLKDPSIVLLRSLAGGLPMMNRLHIIQHEPGIAVSSPSTSRRAKHCRRRRAY